MALTMLPVEVLEHIIEYLSVSDRVMLNRTCRTLNNARTTPVTASVTFGPDNTTRIMNSLKVSDCLIHKFVFESADLQQVQQGFVGWDEFWTSMGTDVETLEFHKCQISERTFLGIINRCPRLTRLVVDECNGLLMSGKLLDTRSMDVPLAFRSISQLEIINNRYLSDALFNRFVSYQKNVTELSVAGCQISFHAAIFKRFYPANGSVLASESVLTFQNIIKCVERHAGSLKCLDFSRTLIDDRALSAVSQIPNLCLEQIILTSCHQLSHVGIEALCAKQRKLQVINLQQCINVCDRALTHLTVFSTVVRELNISDCIKLTDEGLMLLSSLPNVVHLNISVSGRLVTSSGIQTALCTPVMSKLTTLNISASKLTESSIVAIASNLTQLRHLDMSSCCDGVTDVAIQAVTLNCRWLRSLILGGCKNITDYGLTGCHYKVPTISPLSSPALSPTANYKCDNWVNGGAQISVSEDDVTCNSSFNDALSLRRLSGLTKLDLSGCSLISDISLKVAIRFPELTYLDLTLCPRITDCGAVAIAAFNGSLETLKLNQCRNLTDFGVVALVKSLTRLKHFDIQGCPKVGNESVEAVGNWCPNLRFLDVSICPGIASQALLALENKMEHLNLNQRQLSRFGHDGCLYPSSAFSKVKG